MLDFWIGDWVKIKSTGKIGKFEGKINDKAKVKLVGKIVLVPSNDVELLPDELIPREIFAVKKKIGKKKSPKPKDTTNTIDLHIEKLEPDMKNELPELILSYQINRVKRFITYCISRKQLNLTIIHGKGIGALKLEVKNILNSFPEVYFIKEINDGGAVEVILQYR